MTFKATRAEMSRMRVILGYRRSSFFSSAVRESDTARADASIILSVTVVTLASKLPRPMPGKTNCKKDRKTERLKGIQVAEVSYHVVSLPRLHLVTLVFDRRVGTP